MGALEQTGSPATTCERFNVIGRAIKVISTAAAVCSRHHRRAVKDRKAAAAARIERARCGDDRDDAKRPKGLTLGNAHVDYSDNASYLICSHLNVHCF